MEEEKHLLLSLYMNVHKATDYSERSGTDSKKFWRAVLMEMYIHISIRLLPMRPEKTKAESE